MNSTATAFLEAWHQHVRERNAEGLGSMLADDIRMGAPPYWARLEGKATIQHLLGIIANTIDGFTYHREWCDAGEFALEFTGRVGDVELQGIDLISLDIHGKIRTLDVLMRPVSGVIALREIVAPQMAQFLSEPR